MAHTVFFNPPTLSPHQFLLYPSPPPNPLSLRLSGRRRGSSLVTRGAPGINTYIFALVLPLSLLAATVFTAIRISDKLDRDYLEECEWRKIYTERSITRTMISLKFLKISRSVLEYLHMGLSGLVW